MHRRLTHRKHVVRGMSSILQSPAEGVVLHLPLTPHFARLLEPKVTSQAVKFFTLCNLVEKTHPFGEDASARSAGRGQRHTGGARPMGSFIQ